MAISVQRVSQLERDFPILTTVLRRDRSAGLAFDGSGLSRYRSETSTPQCLKYYSADSSTDAIIEHNRTWAAGGPGRPMFQFAYLMLPTPCNQRCPGCFMGQDKAKLPQHLAGPYFSEQELSEILLFMKDHGAKAVVYGGGGELFAWKGAFDLIETVTSYGLGMVVFTNGTLLSKEDIARLNSLGVVLIVSLRDAVEAYHNAAVGGDGFVATLSTIEYALAEGFHRDSRLAVEIPVTKDNEQRVIDDFLPAMRSLSIVPMIEEFIQISTSDQERRICHSFGHSRAFFERARAKDAEFGIQWRPEFGQRIVAQPQCKRPLYSVSIFPSRDVMDCPSHSICYGNLRQSSLKDIVYSERFKKAILDFELCACSVFYTSHDGEIPRALPGHLEGLR